jgi:hypothetical protein
MKKLTLTLITILFTAFPVLAVKASDIEIVSRFMVFVDGEIKAAPNEHICLGRYKVDRAMHAPDQSKGFPDWNNTAATPSNGMSIQVYELKDGRSWLFSIKPYDKKDRHKSGGVGFGLFCIKNALTPSLH